MLILNLLLACFSDTNQIIITNFLSYLQMHERALKQAGKSKCSSCLTANENIVNVTYMHMLSL